MELKVYYPGKIFIPHEGMRCAVALDISGGVFYALATAQLSYIKEKFSGLKNFEILLYSFDTTTYGPTIYTADTLQYITNFEYSNYGGGTLFEPAYDTMVESGADTFVMFSDGYFADNIDHISDDRLNLFLMLSSYPIEQAMPNCNIIYYHLV